MKTKRLLLGTLIAGILTVIFGGKAFATAGNTAEISGGKTWNICVEAGAGYDEADFVVDIAKSGFESQLVLDGGDCKAVTLTAGTYTTRLNNVMGAGAVSYETADDTLTFTVADAVRKYLNTFGSIAYTVEGSGEESPFELLFSMPGECQFNGNANVSGETCKDGDGNPLTDKKYIDTNVALFSSDNAAKDFEIYFTLTDYAKTQPQNQATLFNAKYENSSMYYPGFTLRTLSNNGDTLQLTGRYGKDNTDADKANINISGTSIKGKEVKIVRVDGMVSYSIDGGEMIPFQNYKNFSRYFNQTAVFGASMQTNGNPQRYYDGTIKDIRVYLKKDTTAKIVFDANGGTGTMAAIEDIEVGTDVVLPANTFTLQNATFDGWNTKTDGTGTAYADGATVSVSAVGAIHLYARWKGGRAVLDSGANVNVKLKRLSGVDADDYQDADGKIKSIKTASALPEGFDTLDTAHIVSANAATSPEPIYAWFDDTDYDSDGEGDGVIYLYTNSDMIEGGNDMRDMFFQFRSLSDISALASWNTSNVKDMSEMFALTKIANTDALETKQHEGKDYVSWDTSSVVDMNNMFASNGLLTDISALASWNTSNVKDMNGMFSGTKIIDVDALETKRHEGKDYVSWDTSSVVNMENMFFSVTSLTDISALASWNTSSVTNMSGMFYYVPATPLPSWYHE